MDEQHALNILSALAAGTDPSSGEVFPPDSPYQSADVVRALFVALRALEGRAQTTQRPLPAKAHAAGKP